MNALAQTAPTILVVEDATSLRRYVQKLLEADGFEVLTASDGIEALQLAADYPRKIDLLLSDVSFPEISGPELAKQLKELRPALKVLLMHGGTPKGAERIAACWADRRKVPQVIFKPDWRRHARAAPFKRNDRMLDVLPIGVIVFPGSGISANLADKARKLGIPVWKSGRA